MAELLWDQDNQKLYETGVKKCAFYPALVNDASGKSYGKGVVWNGITAITESPDGAEPTDLYADDQKYVTLRSAETLNATIEAYTYPDAFALCDGTAEIANGVTIGQQTRKAFGLSYRTTVGNDKTNELGYKLHMIYGCTVTPSERAYQTINDSPEAITFSWEMTTTPVSTALKDAEGNDLKSTAIVTIDSTKLTQDWEKEALKELESILYDDTTGYLPLPDEIAKIFKDKKEAALAG